MVALQSHFPQDKLVITGGYRRDRVEVNDATLGAERLPRATNLHITRPYRFVDDTITLIKGSTRTFGAVVTPLPWLGFTYNLSESVFPQGNIKSIFGNVLDPIEGRGHDYSVRFNLLGGRLGAVVNQYRAVGSNQFQPALNTPMNRIVEAANFALTALSARGQALPGFVASKNITVLNSLNVRDATDFLGEGTEIELTGRLARGWSISVNLSRNRLQQSNIATDVNAFIAGVKPDWERSSARLDDTAANLATFVRNRDGTPQRDFVTDPATFADVYAYSASVIDVYNRGAGKAPFTHVSQMANAFTSYRFSDGAPSVLKRSRVGLGANYRGPAVIGYDRTNNEAEILGASSVYLNGMLGKRFPLRKGEALDVQLNVENLLNNNDRLPYSAVSAGNIVRYILPRVRQTWSLRASYTF